MSIEQKVDLNLSELTGYPVISMAQGDTGGIRQIIATLHDGPVVWNIPATAKVMFRYRKPSGLGGMYDEDEVGNLISFSGGVVTIPVAAQVLAESGHVYAEVDVYNTDITERVSAFLFQIYVAPSAYADGLIVSSEYYQGEFQGPQGADGKSAYASAQDGGYTGTEAQFNIDLAEVSSKQPTLVSGTNVKTINNQSILGSGNLNVSGLPTYSTADNGKFLRVVNGSAAWDTVPSAEDNAF